MTDARALHRLVLASGNPGKLKEYQVLAAGHDVELALLNGFAGIPEFPEGAPTFAENAAGKALYYSKHSADLVFADDSGLVVPALGGAPQQDFEFAREEDRRARSFPSTCGSRAIRPREGG